MKYLYLLVTLFIYPGGQAQIPAWFNYQAIARNAAGTPLQNQRLSLRFTIMDRTPGKEKVEYSEFQSTVTNESGLFIVRIGRPNLVINGSYDSINWNDTLKFLKVEMDPYAGVAFIDMGITRLPNPQDGQQSDPETPLDPYYRGVLTHLVDAMKWRGY